MGGINESPQQKIEETSVTVAKPPVGQIMIMNPWLCESITVDILHKAVGTESFSNYTESNQQPGQ